MFMVLTQRVPDDDVAGVITRCVSKFTATYPDLPKKQVSPVLSGMNRNCLIVLRVCRS